MFVLRSSATRFRWIQNYYGEQDEWALDDIYIGQQCPNMCHGHGWCDHGHCRSSLTYTHNKLVKVVFFIGSSVNIEAQKHLLNDAYGVHVQVQTNLDHKQEAQPLSSLAGVMMVSLELTASPPRPSLPACCPILSPRTHYWPRGKR